MQQMKRYSKAVAYGVAMMILSLVTSYDVAAQTSAVSAYSPYTMYGVGELGVMGNAVNRSMGGVGVAWRSSQMVSMLNPAGYSATRQKSFILDISAEGNFLRNTQRKYDAEGKYLRTAKNVMNSVNFRELAIQFPVAKGLGFGLSVAPYGSVGYELSTVEESEDIWGTTGRALYSYVGDGDLTEVKAGVGWEPFRGFSIGVAAKYYWGHISHNYSTTISNDYVGTNEYVSTYGLDQYSISRFKFQVGMQWSVIANEKRLLTLGATYDYGGPLRPKVSKMMAIDDNKTTIIVSDDERGQMRLPHTVNAGVMYQDTQFSAGVDYEWQGWGGNDGFHEENGYGGLSVRYRDTSTIKAGFEYTPNRFDVRHYLRRVSYRVGGRYGQYYQQFGGSDINQWAVTAGFGFPLRFMGATSIDIGVEVGGRGALASVVTSETNRRIGLVKQNYFKVSLGLSLFGEDYWFVRPKFD